jgi:hypothetical protein
LTLLHDDWAGTLPEDPIAQLQQVATENADQVAHWYNPFYKIDEDVSNAWQKCANP